MRLVAVLLLLTVLAGCATSQSAPAHSAEAVEGYLPPGEVNGRPNRLFGADGLPTNFRVNTPW